MPIFLTIAYLRSSGRTGALPPETLLLHEMRHLRTYFSCPAIEKVPEVEDESASRRAGVNWTEKESTKEIE